MKSMNTLHKAKGVKKLKNYLAVFVMLLFCGTGWGQTTSTTIIGDGIYGSRTVPFCNDYRYGYCEQIYAKEEMGDSGFITKISFYSNSSQHIEFDNLKIYLGYKENDNYDILSDWWWAPLYSTDWTSASNLVLSYDKNNVMVGTSVGWQEFTLTTPFAYEAGKNLVVAIAKTSDANGYYGYNHIYFNKNTWRYTRNPNSVRCILRQDDYNSNYSLIPTSGQYGDYTYYRANIKVEKSMPNHNGCHKPAALNVLVNSTGDGNGAVVDWLSCDDESEWEIAYNTTGAAPESGTIITSHPYTISGLDLETSYYVFVRSRCDALSHSGWAGIKFRTTPNICGGSGTQEDPFRICSLDAITKLAMCVNEGGGFTNTYFKVTEDIGYTDANGDGVIDDLDAISIPIGITSCSGEIAFFGNFDGDNHKLKLKMTETAEQKNAMALFGCLGNGATVKNVIVEGEVSRRGSGSPESEECSYTAGIVAFAAHRVGNNKSIQIYNCINRASITSTQSNTGGIIGRFDGTEASTLCLVFDCVNEGTIMGADNCGGIAGNARNCIIDICRNKANISSSGTAVGGVAGSVNINTSIVNCSNRGNVISSKFGVESSIYEPRVGGLIGEVVANSDKLARIQNCCNTGNVTANNAPYAGGLIGYFSNGFLNNCYNAGTVTSTVPGGLASVMGDNSKIEFCYSLQSEMNFVGITPEGSNGIVSDVSQFLHSDPITNTFSENITIGGVQSNDLTTVLNNWIGQYINHYAKWTEDSIDVTHYTNKGFPVFYNCIGLSAPQNIISRVSKDDPDSETYKVELSWDRVPHALSYTIHWSEGEQRGFIYNISTTTYTHRGLAEGRSFRCNVYGENENFCNNSASNIYVTTTCSSLANPTNVRFTDLGCRKVEISWEEVENASGYRVHWGENSLFDNYTDFDNTTNSYIISTFDNAEGIKYRFSVEPLGGGNYCYCNAPIIASKAENDTVSIYTTPNVENFSASISSAKQVICQGEKISLRVISETAVTSYIWSNGETSQEITVNPTSTTTYTVTASQAEGCPVEKSEIITVVVPNIIVGDGDYIWKGNFVEETEDWNNVSNWYVYNSETHIFGIAEDLPDSNKNVVIQSGACINDMPKLSDRGVVKNLLIEEAGILDLGSDTLYIRGDFVNNGVFIANNGTVNFDGNTTLSGTADAENGIGETKFNNIVVTGTFNGGGNPFNIKGNFTNNGTFNSGSGLITFDGTTTIGGSNQSLFYNVEIDGDSITIETEPKITGNAKFTIGKILGDVTFTESSTTEGANKKSYIDGTVTKEGASIGFTFPTGTNDVLGAVTASQIATTSIRYNYKATGMTIDDMPDWWEHAGNMCEGENGKFDHVSNLEYWLMSSSDDLTDVSLTWSSENYPSLPGNWNKYSDLGIAYYDNANCWDNLGGSISTLDRSVIYNGNIGTVTIPLGDRDAKYISVGSKSKDTVLPITLTDFHADCRNPDAEISWVTASEVNNDYFILEKSNDAESFAKIARLEGAGTSIEENFYSYYDNDLYEGNNYYRLKQYDYNGEFFTSEIIVINCDKPTGESSVEIFPNPVSEMLVLVLKNFGDRPAKIEIFNNLGQIVMIEEVESPKNEFEMNIDFRRMAAAAYNIRVCTSDFVINKQVIKRD